MSVSRRIGRFAVRSNSGVGSGWHAGQLDKYGIELPGVPALDDESAADGPTPAAVEIARLQAALDHANARARQWRTAYRQAVGIAARSGERKVRR